MRAAALDLGSNTLRLLVAEVSDGQWRALGRGLATPRLGRGLIPGDDLSPESRRAARVAAAEFTARARALGAGRLALAATQACRAAADGARFVAELADDLGLDSARVLSGREEAALSRLGVRSRLAGDPGGALLADVGGGSSEVLDLGDPADPGRSLPVGAVSLSEAHLTGDPPTAGELSALRAAARDALAPLAGRRTARLVATAGTAAALASMELRLGGYLPELVNNLVVTRARLSARLERLAGLTLAARKQITGLEPERADIILGGLAILEALLDLLDLDRLSTMDAGLLEGILLHDAAGAAGRRPESTTNPPSQETRQ